MPAVFNTVWYLPIESTQPGANVFALRDTGQLIVYDVGLQYNGRRGTVYIQGISRVTVRKRAPDFVNDWVHVEYGQGQIAFFADGSWLGWGGMLGGTRKIGDAVRRLSPR